MLSAHAVVISCSDEREARVIHQSLPAGIEGEAVVTSRRALDGDIATWTLIGTLATPALKVVLGAALKAAELARVRSIRVGDIEVQNPSRADVERLLARIEAGAAVGGSQAGEQSGNDDQ